MASPARNYYQADGASPDCEHCDGVRSRFVRNDYLRGYVCPVCDSSLDEMFEVASSSEANRTRPA
jgi:Zn finger protein HypA/HybF involved in hydrogenase expression